MTTETASRVIPRVDQPTSSVVAPPPAVAAPAAPAPATIEVETAAPAPVAPPPNEVAAPDGSILVPLDAWNRLLGQLGNLHMAGQQLAEARERAGKAETEAEFLRERVRDLKDRLASVQAEALLVATGPEPPTAPAFAPSGKRRWRHYYDLARSLRKQ